MRYLHCSLAALLGALAAPVQASGRPAHATASALSLPQGGQVVFISSPPGPDGFVVINGDGTGLRQLTTFGGDAPAWSPDGTRIAFISTDVLTPPQHGEQAIYIMNSDGTGRHPVSSMFDFRNQLTWSPDGTTIAAERHIDGPDAGSRSEIVLINADGTGVPRPITTNADFNGYPAWSPDGGRIAFSSNRGEGWDIWTMNPDGSDVRQLTSDGRGKWHVDWSSDGSQLAFSGDGGIWRIRADGTGLSLVVAESGQAGDPCWSPDDARIAFRSNVNGQWRIQIVNPDGTDRRFLGSTFHSFGPDWAVAAPSATVLILPDSIKMTKGYLIAGDPAALRIDEGATFRVHGEGSARRTVSWFARFGEVANDAPEIRVAYRASSSPSCKHVLSFYDWDADSWVDLDSRPISTEQQIDVTRSGDVSRFVSGSAGLGEVRVRAMCKRTDGSEFQMQADLLTLTYVR